MLSIVLYLAVSSLVVWLVARRAGFNLRFGVIIVGIPLVMTGAALVRGDIYGPLDLAYTAEPLASVAPQVGAGSVANPAVSDVYSQFFPGNAAVRHALKHHEWPLWNPFILAGTPLAGAVQTAVYHPVTWLALLLPIASGLTFVATMVYFLAALSAFLLAFELTRREIAAAVGAAIWMLSTSVVFFSGTALSLTICIMPLVLLAARRAAREPDTTSTLFLGGVLALMLLGGHPESALHIVGLAVTWWLFEVAEVGLADWKRLVSSGLAAGIGALLVCAISLLPFFEALVQTQEYGYRERAYGAVRTSSSPEQVAHRLRANFFPFLEGATGVEEPVHGHEERHGWFGNMYVGWLALALAAWGLRTRLRERWFFIGAFVFGVGMAIGLPGLTELVRLLPGFSIAVNDRMVTFASLGAAMLAAIGVDAFLARQRPWHALVLVGTAVVVTCAPLLPHGVPRDYVTAGVIRAVLPLAIAAAALVALRAPRAAALILLLIVVERAGEASWLHPSVPRTAFYPPFAGLEKIDRTHPWRTVGVGAMLTPNLSTHYGIEDARGFEAMTSQRLYDTFPLWSVAQPVWSNRIDRLDSPFLSALNVRYAFAPHQMQLPPGWRQLVDTPAYQLAENLHVLPRSWIPKTLHFAKPGNVLARMHSCADFSADSWIEAQREETITNGTGRVDTERSGTGLTIHATLDAPAWIIVSNTAWRGWRAREGSRDLPLAIANHAMLALHLERGEHTVTLRYQPRSFAVGAAISGIALALAAIIAFRTRSRARS